jgi:hypothetical protein
MAMAWTFNRGGNKFGAKKVWSDGICFDSKAEERRYQELKLLERAGKISHLYVHVPYQIIPPVELDGRRRPATTYIADFTYEQDGEQVVEDTKGVKTKDYIIKRKLMKHVHNIEVKEVY